MNILFTGAKGFAGKNLVETLKCIRDRKKKDSTVLINEIYEYDVDSTSEGLEKYTANCGFVFNLARENMFFSYSKETGAKVLVYRFPNLFDKWCKLNYNSAVATFYNAFADEQPYLSYLPKDKTTFDLKTVCIGSVYRESLSDARIQGRWK